MLFLHSTAMATYYHNPSKAIVHVLKEYTTNHARHLFEYIGRSRYVMMLQSLLSYYTCCFTQDESVVFSH